LGHLRAILEASQGVLEASGRPRGGPGGGPGEVQEVPGRTGGGLRGPGRGLGEVWERPAPGVAVTLRPPGGIWSLNEF